jgi:hypothetical protein
MFHAKGSNNWCFNQTLIDCHPDDSRHDQWEACIRIQSFKAKDRTSDDKQLDSKCILYSDITREDCNDSDQTPFSVSECYFSSVRELIASN